MKPLISYYGGKQRIASKILEYFPPHTVYVEPFAGGAALLFAKPAPDVSNNHDYREVINDIDGRLINLYRVAREHPEEFQRWIDFTPYSQAEYRRAIEWMKSPDERSDLELAWAYYVNIQMSFANKLNAGWRTALLGRNEGATWGNSRQRLLQCLERLKNVHISQECALQCISRWDSPQSLFYIDPPYPGTEQGHYSGYTLDDWQDLCDLLDIIQGSYVLSNYPQEIEPKSAQQRVELKALMSASGKGKVNTDRSLMPTQEELGDRQRTEVLWICDRSSNSREDLQKLLNRKQLTIFEALSS